MSQDKKQSSQKGLVVTLKVGFSCERVQKAYRQHLTKVSSQVQLKGFRKGSSLLKLKALEKQRGVYIREEAIDRLLQEIVSESVTEQKHKVASGFTVTKRDGDGITKDVSIELTYEVFGEIPEAKVEKLSVKTVIPVISADNIKAEVEKLQEHHGSWVDTGEVSKYGDQLKIDFIGRLNGELFDGGSASDQEVILGAGNFIPGFEDNLTGHKAQSEVTFKITFPKDYQSEALAGKEVEFETKIQSVQKKELMAIGKEFFEASGSSAEEKVDFEKELEGRLEKDAAHLAKAINRKRILAELKKRIQFPVPDSMLSKEKEIIAAKDDKLSDKEVNLRAESSLMMGLLLRHYIDKWSIKAENEQIREFITMGVPDGIAPEMFIEWYMQDQERLEQITGLVLEQNVFDKLLTVVNIKESKTSIKDLEAELKEKA